MAAKPLKPLGMQGRADFARQVWFANVETDVTISDLLDPAFWVHQTLLQKNDLIEVVSVDGSLDAMLRVIDLHGKTPVLRALRSYVAMEAEAAPGDSIELVPAEGWRALAAGEVVASGLDSRQAAEGALAAFRTGAPE
jgi:hypothetical protein